MDSSRQSELVNDRPESSILLKKNVGTNSRQRPHTLAPQGRLSPNWSSNHYPEDTWVPPGRLSPNWSPNYHPQEISGRKSPIKRSGSGNSGYSASGGNVFRYSEENIQMKELDTWVPPGRLSPNWSSNHPQERSPRSPLTEEYNFDNSTLRHKAFTFPNANNRARQESFPYRASNLEDAEFLDCKPRAFTFSHRNIHSRQALPPPSFFKLKTNDNRYSMVGIKQSPGSYEDVPFEKKGPSSSQNRLDVSSKGVSSSSADIHFAQEGPSSSRNRLDVSSKEVSSSSGDIQLAQEGPSSSRNRLDVSSKGVSSSSGDIHFAQGPSRRSIEEKDEDVYHSMVEINYSKSFPGHKRSTHSPKEDFYGMTSISRNDNYPIPDPSSKSKERDFISNFVCGHLANHAETRYLVILREEDDAFILRLNDLHKINYIYLNSKRENEGKVKKMFNTLRKSKKRKNKVKELIEQFERRGTFETVNLEKKYDGTINIECRVKDGLLWHLLATTFSVQKNLHQDEKTVLSGEPCSETEKTQLWEWKQRSMCHREKFVQLREYGRSHPNDIKEIAAVRVCFLDEFCIGKGSDGTRVYVGLGKDGVEKAVKRMRKDACSSVAKGEMQVLTTDKTIESKNVINYWVLDGESDREYIFLILDLCEETLEDFVDRKSKEYLSAIAANIIRQILQGLADIHRGPMAVVHRDLKPSNIMQNVNGLWLLADFGISRIMENGASTYLTDGKGTRDWMSVEACQCNGKTDDSKIRCKKESDIQVAGMVAFYILTKGKHAFGETPDRLRNLLDGKPVGLDMLKDDAAKDLITWMLSHDPKDRATAEKALKHPYLQPPKQQFEMLCKVGNQPEMKTPLIWSDVVRKLNSDPEDWRSRIAPDVRKYLSTDCSKGKTFRYRRSWKDCLRFMRNVKEHWHERPMPWPKEFYTVGNPQEFFLNLFPKLPFKVHRIIRSCDWKERDDLKEYFV